MSIFSGLNGLRHQYHDRTFTQIETTPSIDKATALLLATFRTDARIAFIDNSLDQDIALYLVHPDLDGSVSGNRLLWLEVPAARVINYGVTVAPGLSFPPRTKLYVHRVGSSAATEGKVRIAAWG